MADERLTIVFMPESAYGPTNNCIGIGKVLERRGHRVVFAAEASWKGKLEPLGFEEDLVDLAPPPGGRRAGRRASSGPTSSPRPRPSSASPRSSSSTTFIEPVFASLIDGARTASRSSRRSWTARSPT